MRNLFTKFRITILVSFILCSFSQASFASPSRNLTIFAEPNMALAISKIAHIFSQKNNIIISVNFNSSEDLVSTIDSGDPADVFISAHSDLIESLRQKGLIDVYNVGYIARDEIALVTSKSNPNPLQIINGKIDDYLKALSQNKDTLIIDNQGSSLGKISKEIIARNEVPNLNIVERLSEDKSSSVIKLLKSDEKLYAFIFKSQITKEDKVLSLAQSNNGNIFYQALVVAGDNMEVAREFLKFLKNPAAKQILKDNGFIVD